MAGNTLSMLEVADMVRHWLRTPAGAYLGQSYGQDIKSLLQQPQNMALGDAFVEKLLKDVPVLQSLPSGTVNVFIKNEGKQRQQLIIDLAGTEVATELLGNIR
ncbi:hypothetical protein [Pseudomonas sp. PS01301]|uniref:hypothetical protein n=1 Tax=Pseudomonas sp. PS01301 TaxID=2991437 RepID=UPI00249A94E9|nr:hypothetical protein [Pseudomonas sp. PS01301]